MTTASRLTQVTWGVAVVEGAVGEGLTEGTYLELASEPALEPVLSEPVSEPASGPALEPVSSEPLGAI